MNRHNLTDLVLARVPQSDKGVKVKALPVAIKTGDAAHGETIDFLNLVNAAALWAQVSTNSDLQQAADVRRSKLRAVREFFAAADKDLPLVTPLDVQAWQLALENRGLKARTVYLYSAHLSAFFEWLRRQPEFKDYLPYNPVRAAFPRFPAPYTSEKTRSLRDEELSQLWAVLEAEAAAANSDLAAVRDYAIFRFFTATGARRSEILELRGKDIVVPPKSEKIVFFPRAKGGERTGKTVSDREVRRALENYLRATNRLQIIGTDEALWLAHDRGAETRDSKKTRRRKKEDTEQSEHPVKRDSSVLAQPGLTSRAFANRMKKAALRAGISNFHLHQLRHTFARIVSEETGSLSATQEALGHKDMKTTGIYVGRIKIKTDEHSERLSNRIKTQSQPNDSNKKPKGLKSRKKN